MPKKMECIEWLMKAGVAYNDAVQLRRISMTLSRWHELECGDGNDHGSWTITRGRKETRHGQHEGGHGAHYVFVHDEDGKPFLEHHHYLHGRGKDTVTYSALADKETAAKRRLDSIMKRYPHMTAYIQGDPRGASLYILRPGDIPEGADVSSCYSRGVAVYK